MYNRDQFDDWMAKMPVWAMYTDDQKSACWNSYIKNEKERKAYFADYDRRYLEIRSDLILNGMDSDDADVEAAEQIEREDEEAREAEEDDNTCNSCDGTGIGQYGDPDTSRCTSCGGKGFYTNHESER